MRDVQLAQIQGFLEVARRGNVSRAAEALRITQPALTARLQALETELGQPLFVRTRRGVQLTDAGQAFLPYAEQAVTSLASGIAEVGAVSSGGGGELALAVAPQVSTYVLPHLLTRFAEEHPGVRLVVRTAHSEEIIELVVRREVHVGLGRQVRHPLVRYSPIYDDVLVLVCAPDSALAGAQSAWRAALADTPLILFDRASSYYELTTALLREAGVRPRGVIELDNVEAAKRLVAGGLGVALLPRTSVAEEVASGSLVALRIEDADPQPRHIGVLRRTDAGQPSQALSDFLELCRRVPDLVPGAVAPDYDGRPNPHTEDQGHGRQGTRKQGRRQEAEDEHQEAEGRDAGALDGSRRARSSQPE
jgi:DNA-binding transcriptional LysR family regulator